MTRNAGTADRLGRLVVAAAAALLGWVGFDLLGGILLLALAGLMVATWALAFGPSCLPVRISTYPTPHRTSKSAKHRLGSSRNGGSPVRRTPGKGVGR